MKNKKEFFGVLLSVLVCVFLVYVFVYATTTVSDDITVGDDLTLTGIDLTFGNGAVLTNTDPDVLDITEAYVSVSGDLNIEGNDLIFGGGAILNNTDPDVLTITEDWVSVSAGFNVEGNATVSQEFQTIQNAYFDGQVSVSDSGFVVHGATIIAGETSQSAACVKGSIYLNTTAGNISICDATGDWSLISNN